MPYWTTALKGCLNTALIIFAKRAHSNADWHNHLLCYDYGGIKKIKPHCIRCFGAFVCIVCAFLLFKRLYLSMKILLMT